jgi:hypothetical protein
MLLLGGVGMLAGFWFDARTGNLAALAGVCLGEKRGIAATLALHWNQLPAMHLGMVAGSLASLPLLGRFGAGRLSQWRAGLAQNLACSAWMVFGMAAARRSFWSSAASPAACRQQRRWWPRWEPEWLGAWWPRLAPASLGRCYPTSAPLPKVLQIKALRGTILASRPNGRVLTARFFWSIAFWGNGKQWHCRTSRNKP